MDLNRNTDTLFLAYRQAKIALFFERRGVGLIDLAAFEHSLDRRLSALAAKLAQNDGWFATLPVGNVWATPKKLHTPRQKPTEPEVLDIAPRSNLDESSVEIQFRLTPSPESAIIEVLFLWTFGPILQSILSKNAIGYRLDVRGGALSRTRRWLFEYWKPRYREFRAVPLAYTKKELDSGRPVLLLSADLTSFYDTIDPQFLLTADFKEKLAASYYRRSRKQINFGLYDVAVSSLLSLYGRYRRRIARQTGIQWTTGIPIGSLTSRLVANIALATLDQEITDRPTTLCYRRYVDDLLLVCRPEGDHIRTLEESISAYIPCVHGKQDVFNLDTDRLSRPGSDFRIHKKKCRVIHLQGSKGNDFVAAVNADIGRLVSESRAFLDPLVLSRQEPLPNLVRVGPADRPLTVLRDADRARLEHWALSNRLRSLERISVLVAKDEARNLTEEGLQESCSFLVNHHDWVENFEIVLRILRLQIRAGDWVGARRLMSHVDGLIERSESLAERRWKLEYRRTPLASSSALNMVRDYVQERRLEAICSAIRPSPLSQLPEWLRNGIGNGKGSVGIRRIFRCARLMAAADLRTLDREDDSFGRNTYDKVETGDGIGKYDPGLARRLQNIGNFVEAGEARHDAWRVSAESLYLCTRPPSYADVAIRLMPIAGGEGKGDHFERVLSVTNDIRGTTYRDSVARIGETGSINILYGGDMVATDTREQYVVLGNLVLTEEYWKKTLRRPSRSGRLSSVRTIERLSGLDRVLSEANKVGGGRIGEKLCILPELALPRDWLREVANYVARTECYGLIVGLEYLHAPYNRFVSNQVYMVVPTRWQSAMVWRWDKRFPAREESKELRRARLSFAPPGSTGYQRDVVDTKYGRVSTLICSELIEAERVADLMGRVEIVAVPSWNKDTASYAHLIQSVGLQLNSVVAIANNGHYSDCRVWAPHEARWKRDLCRLICRDENDVVGVRLPLTSLRRFRKMSEQEREKQKDWRPLPPNWPA